MEGAPQLERGYCTTLVHRRMPARCIAKMVRFEGMDYKSNTLRGHTTHALRQSETQLCHVDVVVVVAVLV